MKLPLISKPEMLVLKVHLAKLPKALNTFHLKLENNNSKTKRMELNLECGFKKKREMLSLEQLEVLFVT